MKITPQTFEEALAVGWIATRENYEGRYNLAVYKRRCQKTGRPLVSVTLRRRYATLSAFWQGDAPPAFEEALGEVEKRLIAAGYGRAVRASGFFVAPSRVPIPEALDMARILAKAIMNVSGVNR